MNSRNDPVPETPLFAATITPHRSLSRAGFIAFMVLIGTLSSASGVMFFLIGAWPVMGFLGLDVLLIYIAFKANYRAARAYERIDVTPSELTVEKVGHHGEIAHWTLNPLWVRVERQTDPDFGLERLFLVSRGDRLPVADFLSPEEREGFARALINAIVEAKRGPVRTVFP